MPSEYPTCYRDAIIWRLYVRYSPAWYYSLLTKESPARQASPFRGRLEGASTLWGVGTRRGKKYWQNRKKEFACYLIFLKILTRGIDHTFSHSEQKKFGEQNYKGCKKNYSAHIFSHVPSNFTLFLPKKSDKNEGDTPAVGVSPFLYTNIQHISAKSKCPPSELEISLFLIFIRGSRSHRIAKKLHTELKVAVRTCEGKAIHGIHRKVSTYLQVSARMFFSH